MPNRIPTPGVKTPAVRVSKSAQPAAKPASSQQIKKAETMLSTMKPTGDIGRDKATVAKKTGVWPNGKTN